MRDDVKAAREFLGVMANGLAPEAGRGRVVVLSEQGRGDQARAIAICAAIHSADATVHITLVGHYDGTMAKRDMAWLARDCGVIDSYVESWPVGDAVKQRMSTADLMQVLLPHCDVLYDAMPLAVKTYWHEADVGIQFICDNCLAPYRILYDGHPFDNWRLKYLLKTWAELASETTGLDVKASDLACAAPVECAPPPEAEELPPWDTVDALMARSGSTDAGAAAVTEGLPYVVIHTGAGGDCAVKVMPKTVADAIVKRLEADGFPCVQVGVNGEQALATAWKRMSLRLPLTNRLIKGAIALVDNEGFLAHMAAGLGTSAAILFNVTPYEVYGFGGNKNIVPGVGKWTAEDGVDKRLVGQLRRCPMGTCFWGGGWTFGEGWGQGCRMGLRECVNWPRPAEAAEIVARFVAEKFAEREAKRKAVA